MRISFFTVIAMFWVVIATVSNLAFADNKPGKDTGMSEDKRIKVLLYSDKDVYTITTRYGYQTNIVFSSNEEVETISVGDRSPWQIIPAANRFSFAPMEENVTTNMTILTNKHSYQFDLKSLATDKTEGNIYVAQFTYNDEKKKPATVAQTPETVISTTSNTTSVPQLGNQTAGAVNHTIISSANGVPLNYNYTFSGLDSLAPLQVYDDGKATYIKYSSGASALPTVSVVSSNGNITPATYTVKDDFMVVDGVAGELMMKNAEGTVHIFNESLNP